jgi:hypothetical protein
VVVALLAGGDVVATQSPDCLHGPMETPANRVRREQAISLAQRINGAQKMARRFAPPAERGAYRPLDELFNLPATPAGFRVQHHTDGATYAFSIKDTLDPCRFAVFSDQDGEIYEATPSPPQPGVQLLHGN